MFYQPPFFIADARIFRDFAAPFIFFFRDTDYKMLFLNYHNMLF